MSTTRNTRSWLQLFLVLLGLSQFIHALHVQQTQTVKASEDKVSFLQTKSQHYEYPNKPQSQQQQERHLELHLHAGQQQELRRNNVRRRNNHNHQQHTRNQQQQQQHDENKTNKYSNIPQTNERALKANKNNDNDEEKPQVRESNNNTKATSEGATSTSEGEEPDSNGSSSSSSNKGKSKTRGSSKTKSKSAEVTFHTKGDKAALDYPVPLFEYKEINQLEEHVVKDTHSLNQDGENDEDTEYAYSDHHVKSKSSKAKKGRKGKRHNGKGGHTKKEHSHNTGELRYFEASLLLEMKNHYTAPELKPLHLDQLETAVQETYNTLSNENCDLQGRQIIEVNMEPTSTSTGYIFHLQGQCYGCNPAKVRLFAHEDDVFYLPENTDDDASENGSSVIPEFNQTTNSNNASMTTVPSNMNMSMMNTMYPTPPIDSANFTAATDNNSTGRNADATHYGDNGLLKKKEWTASKQRSRIQRTRVDDNDNGSIDYGISAESRAAYHGSNNIRQRRHRERGRKLNQAGNGNGKHHHHRTNHHSQILVNRNPVALSHGANVDREPELLASDADLQITDRHGHHYDYDYGGNAETMGDVDKIQAWEMQQGHIMHPIMVHEKETPETRMSGKGSSISKSKSKSKSKSSKQSEGYHPVLECTNANAALRAPSEEEFVLALNHRTSDLMAQYNSLGVNSAAQVQTQSCSATEETFESALVVQFVGPSKGSLEMSEITLVERAMLQSYNHLQATESCDIPNFREMTELVLRGIAPGPSDVTLLAMFYVSGICRGEGCSGGATFFDPNDRGNRKDRTLQMLGISRPGFASAATHDGHLITYNEGSAHVYQDQCYCPLDVEEFGPPLLAEYEEIVNSTVRTAYDEGTLTSIVSVVDIVEVDAPDGNGGIENDKTIAPTEAPVTEALQSFVIVQFFGAQDLVTESEVNAIEDSMPLIYADLQENSFCDPQSRMLTSASLETVDPGPTSDSFLLGFLWEGTCTGTGCSDAPMFFSVTGEDGFIPCDRSRVEGAPVIDDFENNLFQAIIALRGESIIINIQMSGDAVEIAEGSTAVPILGNPPATERLTTAPFILSVADETLPPSVAPLTPAPSVPLTSPPTVPVTSAPTVPLTSLPTVPVASAPVISTATRTITSAPSLSDRSQFIAAFQARYSKHQELAVDSDNGSDSATEAPSDAPTYFPTWIDTDNPTSLTPAAAP